MILTGTRWILAAVLLLIPLPLLAAPQSEPTSEETPVSVFHKGLWDLQLNANYMNDFGDENSEAPSGSIGLSYYLFDNVAIGLEGNYFEFRQYGDDADAWSAGVTLKHHLKKWDLGTGHEKTLFFDFGFSGFQADSPVPRGGTSFNYVTRVGLGLTWQLQDNVHLVTGARYFHLSNAQREGVDKNPSINGVEGFVGIMFTF